MEPWEIGPNEVKLIHAQSRRIFITLWNADEISKGTLNVGDLEGVFIRKRYAISIRHWWCRWGDAIARRNSLWCNNVVANRGNT